MKKQSFLYGAVILTAGMAVVKVIGALFKIPLQHIIGEYGMGLFNVAYNFYGPIFSLATAGFPVAVSRLVSENASLGRWNDVRAVKEAAGPLFLGFGLVGGILMTVFAPFYCRRIIGSENAIYPMLALTPALVFACFGAVYRGYYEGLRNMGPTAVSEIIEAGIKLCLGLGLAWFLAQRGMAEYEAQGTVLGVLAGSPDQAQFLTLAFASAGAVLGVTAGSLGAAAYLGLRWRIKGDGVSLRERRRAPPSRNWASTVKALLKITGPVAAGSIAMNAAGLIDATFLQSRIGELMARYPERLLAVYQGMIPQTYLENREAVPTFLYGCYTLAMTLYLLVPALTQAIGMSALPAVTEAWARGEKAQLRERMESVLGITALVCFPAGVGITALAEPIARMLYGGSSTPIVAGVLLTLGPASLLAAMTVPVSSMLQAVGRADLPVKLMIVAMALKIAVNWSLCGIPEINIQGAGAGTFVCYLFLAVAELWVLIRVTRVKLALGRLFLKPLGCSILCGCAAWSAYMGLCRLGLESGAATGLGILCGGIVYVMGLLASHALAKKDLMMLPKGQKIAKTLEKRGWM
ncbi:putative polysaccharide biosynthesis protein [Acutalibacter sp. 1XD8-33]|uniref:putative polysaccharide biosynthesis protein n=1 Tax=Acutalibacter sp. 1XD8-33 TaxID=2320081 RepID=UPI001FAB181C|nr:polysaccharide biosynthesis protein [Acutalibacter sp. 1XD8-33]